MKRPVAIALLALFGGAHAASAEEVMDLKRLTQREREILVQTTFQTLAHEAIVQKMISKCPADSVGPLLGYYRRRDTEAAFDYYSDFFDKQLPRKEFDLVWSKADASALDCTKATSERLAQHFNVRGSPPEVMGKYRYDAKTRRSGFIPATEREAAEQLGNVLSDYTLVNAGQDGKWLMVRRFASVRHSGCKTVFSGSTLVEAKGVASPANTYTIDWKRVKGVWGYEESDYRTAELDAEWQAAGEVTKFLETGSYTSGTSLLGPFERLRLSCAPK